MSSQDDSYEDVVQEGKLLSGQEREAFKMISTGNDLHGQRALALLAIDEGASQAEAGRRAGLSTGQVKYWLGKFRRVRMEIFPEQVLKPEQLDLEQGDKTKNSKKTKKSKGKKSKKKAAKKSKSKQGKKSKKKKSKKKNTE